MSQQVSAIHEALGNFRAFSQELSQFVQEQQATVETLHQRVGELTNELRARAEIENQCREALAQQQTAFESQHQAALLAAKKPLHDRIAELEEANRKLADEASELRERCDKMEAHPDVRAARVAEAQARLEHAKRLAAEAEAHIAALKGPTDEAVQTAT